MKIETFTPGPWEMFDEGDDHRFWIEGTVKRGNIDYREFVAKTYALPGQREREEANARLIAAAPQLLMALAHMHAMTQNGWITPEDKPTDWQLGWEAACEQFKLAGANDLANTAICKAEGR